MKYAKTVCKYHAAVLAKSSDLPPACKLFLEFAAKADGKRTLKATVKRCLKDFLKVERVLCLFRWFF